MIGAMARVHSVSQNKAWSKQADATSHGSLSYDYFASLIDRASLALILLATVLIPVVIFPDSGFITQVGNSKTLALRTVASLAGLLILARCALWVFSEPSELNANPKPHPLSRSSVVAFVATATGKLWIGIGIYALALVLSALVSISRPVSFWGSIPGTDNGAIYTQLSFLVLAITVPLTIRTPRHLLYFSVAVSISGVIAGLTAIAQEHTGWIVASDFYLGRSTGHFGNPIALGSFLIVTLPITLIALHHLRVGSLVFTTLTAFVFFVHIYGIELTLSRGPYIGLATLLVAGAILYWRRFGLRNLGRISIPISLALVSVLMIASVQYFNDSFSINGSPSDSELGESTLSERLTKQRTIDSRLTTWSSTMQLAADRPTVGDNDSTPTAVRHLFGYGPDTFRYVFQVTASSNSLRGLTTNAHNFFLNILVELGILGVIGFLMILGSVFLVVRRTARMNSGNAPYYVSVTLIAISAMLLGRMTEQMTGVARTSDNMMFWLIVGLVLALPAIMSNTDRSESEQGNEADALHKDQATRTLQVPTGRNRMLAGTALTILVAAMIPVAFISVWNKNIAYAVADHKVSTARDVASVDASRSLILVREAVMLAPDLLQYRHELSNLLTAIADQTPDLNRARQLREEAYESDLTAWNSNPLDRNASFQLAESSWNLAITGVPGKALETIEIYEYLGRLVPNHELVAPRLENLYEVTGIERERDY